MSAALGELLGRARVVDLTYPLTPEFPLFPVYDQLPPSGATVIVGAPALSGGSGGPSRILALIG